VISVLTWRDYGHLRSQEATHSMVDVFKERGEETRQNETRRDEEGAKCAFEKRAFKRSSSSEKKAED